MNKEDRLHEAELGSVWYRDPIIHPGTVIACETNLKCVGHKRPHGEESRTGPWLVMQCYVFIAGWWDDVVDKEDYGRCQENRDCGFCRWFYLVNYGWIYESNLFGFFRRVV